MFVDNDDGLWAEFRKQAQQGLVNEKYISSIRRTDPGEIEHIKLSDIKKWPKRSKAERKGFIKQFISNLSSQITNHGDKNIDSPLQAASTFAANSFGNVEEAEALGIDVEELLFNPPHIPQHLITEKTTVGQLGELEVISSLYKTLGEGLQPPSEITLHNTPLDAIPTLALERKLSAIQRKADRVSGSDLGDGHIATMTLYADFVEVDKRTLEYIRQLNKGDAKYSEIMGHAFRSPYYHEIPGKIEALM